MAKNESLVPDGELEKLKQLDTEIIGIANNLEKTLVKIQLFVNGFAKSNVPFKEFVDLAKEFNTTCNQTASNLDGLNKKSKEREEVVKKVVESSTKEVEAIKQVNEAYVEQGKTLKDISKEGYERASKDIDKQRKNLVSLKVELKNIQKDIKKLDQEYEKGLITTNAYIDRKSVLIAKEQDQKAVVKQESDALKYNHKIISTVIGSYDNLSAQYSRLKIQTNNMTETDKLHGYNLKELEAQEKALYEQMSKRQKATGKHQLDVGQYDKAVGDLTTTLRMLDPSLGMIVGRVQQLTPIKKAWLDINNKLQKSLGLTARGANVLQMGLVGLIAGGIFLAIDAYKKWNKEQEEARETQEKMSESVASTVGKQIVELKKLQDTWSSLTSNDDKIKFIEENKTAFDNLGISVSTVNDIEKVLVNSTDEFIESLKLRAQAVAAAELASGHYQEMIKKEIEIANKQKEADEARKKGTRAVTSVMQDTRYGNIKGAKELSEDYAKSLEYEAKAMEKERDSAKKLGDELFTLGSQREKDADAVLKSIGIRKKTTEDTVAKGDKKGKDEESKFYQELTEFRLQQEAEAQKNILESNKKSYEERMDAVNAFEEKMGEQINQKREYQLKQEGLTKSQIALIHEKADAELNKIAEEGGKLRENIWEDHISAQNKVIEEGLVERNQMLNDNEQQERQRLLNEFQSGKISREEYEKQMTELTVTYSQARLQAEIESIQKMLDVVGISEEDRASLMKKLRKAELDFNKSMLDQQVKAEQDAAKKREDIEKKLAETKKKLGEEVFNFLGSMASAYTDKQLKELEAQQEQNDEWRDAEMQRIEEQEQKGVISKEQAEAQKWMIDDQSRQNEKKIEEEKKKVLERQARFEKASALVQVAMNTAQAVMKNWAVLGPLAGPINAIVIAMGAMQAATILAQPIPKYKQGTDSHKGGLAIVGDGGRHEMAILPSGDIWKTPKTDTLVDLPKGTQVLPDFSKALMNMSVLRANEENRTIVIQEHKEMVNSMSKNNKLLRDMTISQNRIAKELVRNNSNPFNLDR